jgi:hypothetical protein
LTSKPLFAIFVQKPEFSAARKKTSLASEMLKAGHAKTQSLMDAFIDEACAEPLMMTSVRFLDLKMPQPVAMK